MTPIRFTVLGKPEPQRRPRFSRQGNGSTVTYSTAEDRVYADRVRWAWRGSGGHYFGSQPLELSVTAVFARPKSHWRKDGTLSAAGLASPHHSLRPDMSNLIKAVEDSLNGLAYDDDAQIAQYGTARKLWTETPQEAPRLEVEILALRDVPNLAMVE